jgi:RNA ligase (TIGR02306 family)
MRKLVSIQRVAEVKDIPEADKIQAYRINGWWVVDKKEQYNVGDLVVYCEVDSWIPHEVAPFLSKGKEPSIYEGVKGERLRTVKLKKQVSQGLILSVSILANAAWADDGDGNFMQYDPYDMFQENEDVSEYLGIIKWEPKLPLCLAGDARGLFPGSVPKTDQERVQNLNLEEYLCETYEVTEKLHGSSCTFFLDSEGDFHVCSRNLDLKFSEGNAYWKAAVKYNIEQKLRDNGLLGYALQGEICGEGLNGNNYKLGLDWFMFDVYKEGHGYLKPQERRNLCEKLGLKHVPVIDTQWLIKEQREELLILADGTSKIADCKREGFVFKSNQSEKTFKVVSNAWLLKYE